MSAAKPSPTSAQAVAPDAWLELYEPPSHRVTDQPRGLVNIELLHQARAVRLGRFVADVQDPCDLLGRLALRDQLQDLALTRRQVLCSGLVLVEDRVHERDGHRRTDIHGATGHFV